jgi:hypothetical protein
MLDNLQCIMSVLIYMKFDKKMLVGLAGTGRRCHKLICPQERRHTVPLQLSLNKFMYTYISLSF